AGFLGPILEGPKLEDAVIRKAGVDELPQPVRLLAEDLFFGRYNRQLVQIEAYFLEQVVSPTNGLTLALQAGPHFLNAILQVPGAQSSHPVLDPGSRLRLTGVCRTTVAPTGHEPEVSLLLRSPTDVQLVAVPPAPPRRGLKVPWAAAISTAAAL